MNKQTKNLIVTALEYLNDAQGLEISEQEYGEIQGAIYILQELIEEQA